MAKISLYPHHNYWWAPVWDSYPCLLHSIFFASIIQCFENMQLTTKSFLNFTSASLRWANVKEQLLLEVVFLVLAYAPYFQRHCFPQAQWVAGRREKVTSSRVLGTGSSREMMLMNKLYFGVFSCSLTLWLYSKCSLNYCVILMCLRKKLFIFPLLISFSVEHQTPVYTFITIS